MYKRQVGNEVTEYIPTASKWGGSIESIYLSPIGVTIPEIVINDKPLQQQVYAFKTAGDTMVNDSNLEQALQFNEELSFTGQPLTWVIAADNVELYVPVSYTHLLKLDEYMPELGKTLGEEILTPTKIYVKAIKHLFGKVDLHGMSHVTGGGFYENLPRMLHDGEGIEIDVNAFPKKPIFELLQKLGNIDKEEMYNVFNMGIGFVCAVDADDAEKLQQLLKMCIRDSCCAEG